MLLLLFRDTPAACDSTALGCHLALPPFRLDSIAGAVDGSRGRDPNGSGAGAARTGIGGVLSRVCVLFRPWGVFGTIWIPSCYAAASSLSACCTAFATPGMLRFVVLHCF
jgi:hypothetical protein